MGRTTNLRRELKRTFYPYVIERGFQIDKSTGPHSIDFRRFGSVHIDVFDIQWEKYGRPRFVVNFGQTPSAGVTHFGESIPPEKVLSYMGSHSGRLQPHAGASTGSWFRQDYSFLRRIIFCQTDRPAEEVVGKLMSLFKELESWFEHGQLGPHMKVLPYPWQRVKENQTHVEL
ncbi:MAG: hypothetical protein SFU55_02135 [Methylophilus sp.]|nr:hypothetical protein [Methylophilus sp.]